MKQQLALLTLLSSYQAQDASEILYKRRFEKLLESADCFERRNLVNHFTGSCWVTNVTMDKVLLLHHAKLGKWLQPGGHADGNPNLIAVAKKELAEETGIREFLKSPNKLFDIDIHEIPERKGVPCHEHFDSRFHFIVNENLPLRINEESKGLKWVMLNEVPQLTMNEPSILRMVQKTRDLIV